MNTSVEHLQRVKALFNDVLRAQDYIIHAKRLTKEEWNLIRVYLHTKEYFEVVEERNVAHRCGFLFCDKHTITIEEYQLRREAKFRNEEPKERRSALDPLPHIPDQILKFSRELGEFVDIKEQLYYCSKACYVESKLLAETLDAVPIYLRDIPFTNFKECMEAMKESVRNAKERGIDNDGDIIMDRSDIQKSRQLNAVKEELAAVNALGSTLVISEREETEPPSQEFQNQDDEIRYEMLLPEKSPSLKPTVPFYSFVEIYLYDSVSPKTIQFLKTMQQDKTEPCEEYDFSFPSLSASTKRFQALERVVSKRFNELERTMKFDWKMMSFIRNILQTFTYTQAVKVSRQFSLLITLILIFIAGRYNVSWQASIDANLTQLKRLLRIDCGMKRGQFEELLKYFDVSS